jgi:hypothetical protein
MTFLAKGPTDYVRFFIFTSHNSLLDCTTPMRLTHSKLNGINQYPEPNREHIESDCMCLSVVAILPTRDGIEAVQRVLFVKAGMYYEMPMMDGPTAFNDIRILGCDLFVVSVTCW